VDKSDREGLSLRRPRLRADGTEAELEPTFFAGAGISDAGRAIERLPLAGAGIPDAGHGVERLSLAGAGTTFLWLLLTTPLLARYASGTGRWEVLVAHAAAMALVALAILARRGGGGSRTLLHWCPLLLGPFLYHELGWLIEGTGRPHMDPEIRALEAALFPTDPSTSLRNAFPNNALSEILHAAYLSFYAIVYVPPALLYLRKRHLAFAFTAFALLAVFATCFTIFLFIPVDGPRYMMEATHSWTDAPVRSATHWLLNAASARGTAFPSAHVAASVAATVCALRFQRPVGYLLAIVTGALAVSTVYGGFHYAVDVVAGALLGSVVSIAVVRGFPGVPGDHVG
jgi:membrane-associated phospholipid phosphatase